MKYTWRISLTAIIILINIASVLYFGTFSIRNIIAIILNAIILWLIGHQIDKYRFSKKELGTTKTTLIDYSYALDSAADAIGITNESGQFVFVNKAHTKLYGYSKEESLNLKWGDCYSKETSNELQKIVPKYLERGTWKTEVVGVRKDGTTFPQEISLSYIPKSKKTVCIVRDITERKKHEKYMKYIAEHSDLTQMPNRRKMLADLASCESDATNISFLFIDIDRFKLINETLGHSTGDELLQSAAQRLNAFHKRGVNLYHIGGDQFIAIIKNAELRAVKSIASNMIQKITEPFNINGNEILITASIGISRYPDQTKTAEDLINMADIAMYQAKLDETNTFRYFNNDLRLKVERKTRLETDLQRALKNEELFMVYQPKYNIKSGKLAGVEALIRWRHPELGLIPPSEFIPIAEETGLIIPIGNWIIQTVLNQMKAWCDEGHPLIKISVNVSQRQFRNGQLVNFIRSCLKATNTEAQYLEIEVTETIMENRELIIPKLHELKGMGVSIAIDDFGTGYSSLNSIKDLPIDTLKIDQSFIRDLIGNSKELSLVKIILEIGNIFGLEVVAEGIETEEHLNILLEHGCPIGQGYFFSKPVSASEVF